MFQFPWLASTTYLFSRRLHSMTCARLPHSGISGSTPVSGSPKLIAACYALHRPLTPRNPPQALLRLINKSFLSYFKQYSIIKELRPIKLGLYLFFILYARILIWWRWTGSNRRPPACKAGALPAELHPPLISYNTSSLVLSNMVGLDRFELSTSRLSGVRSNQLSYRPARLLVHSNKTPHESG